MSLTLTIAGVNKTNKFYLPSQAGALDAQLMAGARGSLRLRVYDLLGAAGYRPAIDDLITLASGATTIFAGIIDDVEEEGLSDLDTGVITTITASDWHDFCDRLWVTAAYNAGTSLRDVLNDLRSVSGITVAYGVTLDAGAMGATFPNGPLMTSTTTFDCSLTAALNKLRQLTGFIWRITPGKVLQMQEPAWVSCGYSLADASTTVVGKVTWKKARATGYVNRVRVTAGPSGPGDPLTQTWNGNGVLTVFSLSGVNVPASNAWPGTVAVDGITYPLYPPGTAPGGNGIEWDWTLLDGKLSFLGTSGAIATGATHIVLVYTPLYPFTIVAVNSSEVTAHGPYDSPRVTATEVLAYAEAVAIGNALVRVRISTPQEVTVVTTAGIAYPGQSVALSFTERAIAATFLISAVAVRSADDGSLEYVLTCLSGTELISSWLDFYKASDGASGGGTTVAVAGGGTSSTTVITGTIYLGGARKGRTVIPASGVFVPVPDYLPFFAAISTSMRLRAFASTQNSGISVTIRLYDVTAAAPVPGGTSAPITATVSTAFTAVVALIAGHEYRLEVCNSATGEGVSGLGFLEGL